MANKVYITGTVGRVSSGRSDKGPWAFAVVQPDDEPGRFDVSAFDAMAETLIGLTEGARVEVKGKLWRKKDNKTERWNTIIRAEEVSEL